MRRLLVPLFFGLLGFALTGAAAVALAADPASMTPEQRISVPIAFRLGPPASINAPVAADTIGSERTSDHLFQLLPDDPSGQNNAGEGWRLATGHDLAPVRDGMNGAPRVGPDWAGIGRDTAFIVAYQTISVAILYGLPGDFNRWQNDDVSIDNWWDNVKQAPIWDSDPWGTNYITHPYWGATYYVRARERGFGKLASFGYSALLSTLYEYGAEAFFEPPSAQDLMVTPILGSLIGAFVFEPIRDWVKVKPEFKWYDQALLIATDPLGTLNSVFERLLGIKSEILLRPSPPPAVSRALGGGERDRRIARPQGFSVTINMVWE